MSLRNRLDIIVFGASGFTGRRTALHLSKVLRRENSSLAWGLAGRSKEKLRKTLLEIQEITGENHSDVPIILADVDDVNSLESMSAQAKLVVNAVGPYQTFGERVIQACINSKTHHIDLSGETQYMEAMQLKYHDEAKEKGIFLISACGIESIPSDLGAIFLQKNFDGILNSIQSYLTLKEVGEPHPGALVNYGSYESGVHLYVHRRELRGIRSKLYPEPLPAFKPKLQFRGLFFKENSLRKWCTMFPGPDEAVVGRTQRYLYETEKQRPVQMRSYLCYDSFLQVIAMGLMAGIFVLMCLCSFTQKILLRHPKIFTFGLISREGPSEAKQENTLFDLVLVGEGWSEKLTDVTNEYDRPPDKKITARISCMNPIYGSACVIFVLAAVTILQEGDRMPKNGGCYPPGAAFANTSMIEKLNKYDVKFELNPVL